MANHWTEEQEQVIHHSEGNLLVSAAAGSGKTAVLVERILTMLQEEEHPIDIDRMLVVTFTKAAAAEMRERIGKNLAELIGKYPDREQLQRQQLLLHQASITTIDSFCMQLVKEFFHMIDLDPGFRVGEEAEMQLLRNDVLKELLQDRYTKADPDFLRFVECYAPGRTDEALEDYIIRLHLFSESYAWPNEWLEQQLERFSYQDVGKLNQSELVSAIMEEVRLLTENAAVDIEEAYRITKEAELTGYLPAVEQDKQLIERLCATNDYLQYARIIKDYEFIRLGNCKKDVDVQEKEKAKELRSCCKDALKKIREIYFFQEPEAMLQDMTACENHMRVLIRLVQDFRMKYEQTKREKNLVDFADLEHYALQILLTEKEGKRVPSDAAGILQERYDRIMIDEYQDSNLVQETLLNALSRVHRVTPDHPDGQPNVFMVGDVKQSIYRFRQARPELFMDKYESYQTGKSLYQKIILRRNFRSRPSVLNGVNSIFEWCMHENYGKIEYDTDAALHPGLNFTEEQVEEYHPELILLYKNITKGDGKPEKTEDEEEEEAPERIEAEARACAERIRQLTDSQNGLRITKDGETRTASYCDVAILLRSAKGWAETFLSVLRDAGIPAVANVSGGFFQTGEIVTIMNYLRILDNPRQDIPFAQVLLSPMVKLSNNDLVLLRGDADNLKDAVLRYEEDTPLYDKVKRFREDFCFFRERMKYLGISDLLQEIYRRTGFYECMSALPAGKQRAANLDFLLEQAQQFASTSYHGLFQFVRYVEKLKENELDYGEADILGGEDAVRIMTIHKSKGLEFPIVFVPACGKKFNRRDADTSFPLHAEYGLGPDCIDSEKRTRIATLQKQYIRRSIVKETIAEELRMLYVAMTRAREKLIMVGSTEVLDVFLRSCTSDKEQLEYSKIAAAGSYLDFMKGILLRSFADKDVTSLEAKNLVTIPVKTTNSTIDWVFCPTRVSGISKDEALRLQEETNRKEELLTRLHTIGEDMQSEHRTTLYQELADCLAYRYPYEAACKQALKTSVSELKHRAMAEAEREEPDTATIPEWLVDKIEDRPLDGTNGTQSRMGGSERGTLYHTILEFLPFSQVTGEASLHDFLMGLVTKGRITEEERALLREEKLLLFLQCELAERMRAAEELGKLRKEQPFVLGLPVNDGSGDYELIQGIIDVFFEEEDGLVLADYKTDVAEKDKLCRRYETQLAYYAKALEQITGKKVKERYLYSFHLSELIRLDA